MMYPERQRGFSLVEMLVATAVFSFIIISVSGLYTRVLGLQRRAIGAARVQENALFVIESIAREIRVSRIPSGDSDCTGVPDPVTTRTIMLDHPVEGAITYAYDAANGVVLRNGEELTSPEVRVTSFAFCVSGSGPDDLQARVTIPMTLENIASNPAYQVSVALQTTVVSRDLVTDLSN
ncbi:MAG TPA: prepilin-type N-terminal cleavage/methylation domain-containing protein [Candidatus Paceibacterota bacterium]|nr:prepilin-type N-terminal cleavage/methylation domain-containing protein [Candidatus Paceibacterota bacterium]